MASVSLRLRGSGCAPSAPIADDDFVEAASEANANLIAAAAAEAAEQTAKESSLKDDDRAWVSCGGSELEAVLESGAEASAPIALIDARFLISLADKGGVLRRRQDLPRRPLRAQQARHHRMQSHTAEGLLGPCR